MLALVLMHAQWPISELRMVIAYYLCQLLNRVSLFRDTNRSKLIQFKTWNCASQPTSASQLHQLLYVLCNYLVIQACFVKYSFSSFFNKIFDSVWLAVAKLFCFFGRLRKQLFCFHWFIYLINTWRWRVLVFQVKPHCGRLKRILHYAADTSYSVKRTIRFIACVSWHRDQIKINITLICSLLL